ncbi:MAG: AAA family ATPase [Acidobacteriaceae bacterium]
MVNIGLAGAAGCGKDTVADYLVRRYGFVKYSFSDALYREVADAFGLDSDDQLRNRALKETPTSWLALEHCSDSEFSDLVVDMGTRQSPVWRDTPLSPRQVLQWWGADYRRAQNPQYWVERADEWLSRFWAICKYPEQQPQFFVNTSVRFENERQWIHKCMSGNVWHIRRSALAPVHAHASETPLEVIGTERELYNGDSIERLYKGVDLLLTTGAQFVRVEPMQSYSAKDFPL